MSISGQHFVGDGHGSGGGGDREHDEEYDVPVYVISVASELADLHPQTLRSYERQGLVEPHRTDGGTRRYSRRDVDRLRFIRHLTQEKGLNLAGVDLVLRLGEQLEQTRSRIEELEDLVRALASRLDEDAPTGHEIVKAPGHALAPHPRPRRRRGSRAGHI